MHSLSDSMNIDIREEVKFEVPNGDIWTGSWCRPQTDGAALRVVTLLNYIKQLNYDSDYISK